MNATITASAIAAIINKTSVDPCLLKTSYAINPLAETKAEDKRVRRAKIANKVKCGLTCVTSKIFKNTKQRAANPSMQAIKIDRGLIALSFDDS